ncbi:unnamed protein product [Effrenium voratum]|nr:unnamed protein product [Effrenium voratum]
MAEASTAQLIPIYVHLISGEEMEVKVNEEASVKDLRDAIEGVMHVGLFAYRLVHGSTCLQQPSAKLRDLGIGEKATVTMMKERSRDYTKITGAQVMKTNNNFPNGLAYDAKGQLLVATFFGPLEVYSPQLELDDRRINVGANSPSQICVAGGELLVALRSGGINVLDGETYALKRRITWGRCKPSGIAICGEEMFVSDSRSGYLHRLTLSGEHISQRKGGSQWHLVAPSGMCVVEDKLLAVADRGADRVLLLDVETMEIRGQLPQDEAWHAKTAPMALRMPNDVIVDSAGNLLVMDTCHERVAVFRQDGTFVASVLEGFFKDTGNTFSYLACNHESGAVAISNNDKHEIAILTPS